MLIEIGGSVTVVCALTVPGMRARAETSAKYRTSRNNRDRVANCINWHVGYLPADSYVRVTMQNCKEGSTRTRWGIGRLLRKTRNSGPTSSRHSCWPSEKVRHKCYPRVTRCSCVMDKNRSGEGLSEQACSVSRLSMTILSDNAIEARATFQWPSVSSRRRRNQLEMTAKTLKPPEPLNP